MIWIVKNSVSVGNWSNDEKKLISHEIDNGNNKNAKDNNKKKVSFIIGEDHVRKERTNGINDKNADKAINNNNKKYSKRTYNVNKIFKHVRIKADIAIGSRKLS